MTFRKFSKVPLLKVLVVAAVLTAPSGCKSREQRIEDLLTTQDATSALQQMVDIARQVDPDTFKAIATKGGWKKLNSATVDSAVSELRDSISKAKAGDEIRTKAILCLGTIKSDRSIQALGDVIESGGELECGLALTELDAVALDGLIRVFKQDHTSGLSKAIANRGDEASETLLADVGSDNWVTDPLARIGEKVFPKLEEQLKSESQPVRFGAADALVRMAKYHPEVIERLTSALGGDNLRPIAQKYAFYIRLGRSGTEPVLLKALAEYFDVTMCVDYLNCGSSVLASGARKIAHRHGYEVNTRFGSHNGPGWGQGN